MRRGQLTGLQRGLIQAVHDGALTDGWPAQTVKSLLKRGLLTRRPSGLRMTKAGEALREVTTVGKPRQSIDGGMRFNRIEVRVSDAEHDYIHELARDFDQCVSGLIRGCVLVAVKHPKRKKR